MEKNILILDGAMGTMLQSSGVEPGRWPDTLSLTHPELVESIHRAYAESGAGVLYANTFGANRKKLAGSGHGVEEVVRASLACALRAAEGTGARVALDVGPIGAMLEPNGTLSFDEAYDIFREIVCAGERFGAQLIVFETMTDLYELKAAVLAAKENTSLPVWCSMTFEETCRTFTGCGVECMAMTLEGLGADALGINCSLGPEEILPIAARLCAATSLPVFIKPNAGLPDPATGAYDIGPDAFAASLRTYRELGVFAAGGCCGTTPEYIRALRDTLGAQTVLPRETRRASAVCSALRAVPIDGVTVIGERINPTGKARFKQALRDGDIDYILSQAIEQVNAGAQILDVNVGLPEIDEIAMMRRAVKELQAVCELPLQLDSTRPDVLEAGLRAYCGKPIVNSVNAEPSVLDAILPLCKKYGAAVVGLTLDDGGIPAKAEERFALAEKIVRAAQAYGIPREDVYIDCLTLTVSAQQAEAAETLRAVAMVKERLGVKTVLGVSNISFGLPARELVNTTFLTLAMSHGLDLPILNPNNTSMMAAIDAFNVLYNADKGAVESIRRHGTAAPAPAAQPKSDMSLHDAVLLGLKAPAAAAAREALRTTDPETLINTVLIPALDEVGDDFEKGRSFLPQLLQSAGAAQSAFDVVKEAIAATGVSGPSKGKIVIATVKGDIHDIGKNIVKVILENYGYQVIDLGRDVPVQTVVDAAKEHGARLVGLSALMTTTLPAMRDTIAALREQGVDCAVMVGGAVLTPAYAEQIGADYYARDAKASADIAKIVLGN